MIKQHYPLLLFTISMLTLLMAYFDQPETERQNLPQSHDATVTQIPPPPALPPKEVRLPPSLEADDGIIWELSATATLENKLDSCEVTLLNREMPIRLDTRYYFRTSKTTFSLFTPVHPKLSQTIKNHLETIRCLTHDHLRVRDPLTGQTMNARALSRIADDDTIPLEFFFKVMSTGRHVMTRGLKRLGHSELRVFSSAPEVENLTWKLLGLMLTDRPLETLIALTPELEHVVTTHREDAVDLRFEAPTQTPMKRKHRQRSLPKPSTSDTERPSTPLPPTPRQRPLLPDYR
ncbi:MAG: hypothetical protein ACPGQS_07655 [Bradymonadia bacterium]